MSSRILLPRILVLRHEPFEHLGYFAEILNQHKIPYAYHDLEDPAAPPAFDSLIIMGGPQSANDDHPGLTAELRLIENTIAAAKPVLGICLGSQLIAKALGARVYKNAVSEIGWGAVHFTAAAQNDPLFGKMPSPSTFFHWHGETFDLPVGANWLAYSDHCKHQAFRFAANVYGVQFHPEITPAMIDDWCAQPVNCGDVATLAVPIDAHAFDTAKLARMAMEGWLGVAGTSA